MAQETPQTRPARLPDGVTLRAMTAADAPAVVALAAAAERVDRTEEHLDLADVLEEVRNPAVDPARDWVLAERDGRLVGHCRLLPRAVADGALPVAVEGTVLPEERRHGLGAALLDLGLARAQAHVERRAVALGRPLRPVVTVTAPDDLPDLPALLEARGLVADRWSFVMAVDLRETPAGTSPLPDGYTLGSWADADPEALRQAHNAAFAGFPGWTPWDEQMWATWVVEHHASRPALGLVARAGDGRVAAYLRAAEFPAVQEATGLREAYVALVGTLPDHRRRGLAAALLDRALEGFRREGHDRAALEVDTENPSGALRIYEAAGFRVERRWVVWRREG